MLTSVTYFPSISTLQLNREKKRSSRILSLTAVTRSDGVVAVAAASEKRWGTITVAAATVRALCFRLMAFWKSGRLCSSTSSSTVTANSQDKAMQMGCGTITDLLRTLFPARRRLQLDPSSKLYFSYEPGKQVRSAVRIMNTSKSHVVFKFQTTAPKSCFMRPPGGTLSPGESIVATVFKFVEPHVNNEKPLQLKSEVKFKIMSLKVNGPIEFVPELFDEQKDEVLVEQILRVVHFYADRPNPHLDKLKGQLAEADAALEARKKPPEDTGPRIVGEGLVIDEWKERRERYLAKQQVKAVDSV